MSCHRHRKIEPWERKRDARRTRRRGLESWHRNDNADARAILRRVVQAYARRGHDPSIDPIAARLTAIRLDPFGNGVHPKRSREVTRTLLWEAHHLTRSWRMRDPQCGFCGHEPETPCGSPCNPIPF